MEFLAYVDFILACLAFGIGVSSAVEGDWDNASFAFLFTAVALVCAAVVLA